MSLTETAWIPDASTASISFLSEIRPPAGDVATLACKWNKPFAAGLLPAPGKKVGEMTEFSGALANAILQPLPGSPRR